MTRVWLPDSPAAFGGLPAGIEADVWKGGEDLPPSADEVELVVFPFKTNPEILRTITRCRSSGPSRSSAPAPTISSPTSRPYHALQRQGRPHPGHRRVDGRRDHRQHPELPRFAAAQQAGHWDPTVSDLIAGKRVLIVGYGSIGEAVERRLAGWDVVIDRVARRARDGVQPIEELPRLLPEADVVVILVPVTEETRQLVNAEFLKTMKDGALLVNAARGVIVDTDALLAELTSGRLRAALDVTDPEPLPDGHPLWSAPGLLLTPHVGGAVGASGERAYEIVAAQLARLATGRPLLNVIGADGY